LNCPTQSKLNKEAFAFIEEVGAIRYCDVVLVAENNNKRLSNAPKGRLRIGEKFK